MGIRVYSSVFLIYGVMQDLDHRPYLGAVGGVGFRVREALGSFLRVY